jgi:hypothetical protein
MHRSPGSQRRCAETKQQQNRHAYGEDQHRFCVHDRDFQVRLEKEYRRKPAISSRALASALSAGRDKFRKKGYSGCGAGRGLA